MIYCPSGFQGRELAIEEGARWGVFVKGVRKINQYKFQARGVASIRRDSKGWLAAPNLIT